LGYIGVSRMIEITLKILIGISIIILLPLMVIWWELGHKVNKYLKKDKNK